MKSSVFQYSYFPPMLVKKLTSKTVIIAWDEETEGMVDPNQPIEVVISIRAMSQEIADKTMENLESAGLKE